MQCERRRTAHQHLVVKVIHGPEEIQTLGSRQPALVKAGVAQGVQDLLQQVHLTGILQVGADLARVVTVL